MTRVYNRAEEKGKRRRLRAEMPRAEVILWSRLRNRQIGGLKFRRQYGVGPYVIDFYCAEARLAVEVDGDSHFGDGAEGRDSKRQAYIESFGIAFVRCTNGDVYDNLDGVLEEVHRVGSERLAALLRDASSLPLPGRKTRGLDADRLTPPQSPPCKGGEAQRVRSCKGGEA